MKPLMDAATLLGARPPAAAPAALAAAAPASAAPPELVGKRLAEYVLLAGIPLRYLVPDPARLPDDALRVFELDPDWLEALMDGMLSIGLGPEAEDAAGDARSAAADAVPFVRDLRRGKPVPDVTPGAATTRPGAGICGLLLRSSLVERWPGLIIRAYTGTVPDGQDPDDTAGVTLLAPLRLERLTPSILVALWARRPDLLVIQEPPSAPRLGVERDAGNTTVRVRGADGTPTGAVAAVPVDAATGVVDFAAFTADLRSAGHVADAADGAAVAMQLLQPPVRRRYRREAS